MGVVNGGFVMIQRVFFSSCGHCRAVLDYYQSSAVRQYRVNEGDELSMACNAPRSLPNATFSWSIARDVDTHPLRLTTTARMQINHNGLYRLCVLEVPTFTRSIVVKLYDMKCGNALPSPIPSISSSLLSFLPSHLFPFLFSTSFFPSSPFPFPPFLLSCLSLPINPARDLGERCKLVDVTSTLGNVLPSPLPSIFFPLPFPRTKSRQL